MTPSDETEIDGNAEIYRNFDTAPAKKSKASKEGQPQASASAEQTKANKPRQIRGAKVTPSPKAGQLPLNQEGVKNTRPRNNGIKTYFRPRSEVPKPAVKQTTVRSKMSQNDANRLNDHSFPARCMGGLPTGNRSTVSMRNLQTSAKTASSDPCNIHAHDEIQTESINDRRYITAGLEVQGVSEGASDSYLDTHHSEPKTWQSDANFSTKYTSTKNMTASSTMWSQARRDQERHQKRAFSREKENPFSQFKYDPNDGESLLDALNQRTPPSHLRPASSIIPQDSQRVMDQEYARLSHHRRPSFEESARASTSRRIPKAETRQHRRFCSRSSMYPEEVLFQKAREQQFFSPWANSESPFYNETYPCETLNSFIGEEQMVVPGHGADNNSFADVCFSFENTEPSGQFFGGGSSPFFRSQASFGRPKQPEYSHFNRRGHQNESQYLDRLEFEREDPLFQQAPCMSFQRQQRQHVDHSDLGQSNPSFQSQPRQHFHHSKVGQLSHLSFDDQWEIFPHQSLGPSERRHPPVGTGRTGGSLGCSHDATNTQGQAMKQFEEAFF